MIIPLAGFKGQPITLLGAAHSGTHSGQGKSRDPESMPILIFLNPDNGAAIWDITGFIITENKVKAVI